MVKQLLACICFLFASVNLSAGTTVDLRGVRLWSAPDNTRVVFDVSGTVSHTLFSLDNPERLVIDMSGVRLGSGVRLNGSAGLVKRIRSAPRKGNGLRVVLDLTKGVRPKSFSLKPNKQYGHRLVIDLFDPAAREGEAVRKTIPVSRSARRDLVIAIDAGHGGEDPGARGAKGTREKDVVLAIARRLAALVKKEPGMRPVMIRDGDYYVGLRQRIEKARRHRADLFISIHADAFHDRRAHGSSVFVLSQRGASSEMARWLAESENAADLSGGVSLDDKDKLLAEVLLDLSQNASREASLEVAQNLLGELRPLGKMHKTNVQQAGFVVLKSPDIPSLLVETAFISNPSEERKLRNGKHQQALAEAMLRGIRSYFARNPPPGTTLVAREHVIKRGETLSHIAMQYKVTLNRLRGINGLTSDRVNIGDVLRIPPAKGS